MAGEVASGTGSDARRPPANEPAGRGSLSSLVSLRGRLASGIITKSTMVEASAACMATKPASRPLTLRCCDSALRGAESPHHGITLQCYSSPINLMMPTPFAQPQGPSSAQPRRGRRLGLLCKTLSCELVASTQPFPARKARRQGASVTTARANVESQAEATDHLGGRSDCRVETLAKNGEDGCVRFVTLCPWPKVLSKKTMSLSMDLGTPTMDKGLGDSAEPRNGGRRLQAAAHRCAAARLQTCPSSAPLGTASSLQPAAPKAPPSGAPQGANEFTLTKQVLSTIAADGEEPQGQPRAATARVSPLAWTAAC